MMLNPMTSQGSPHSRFQRALRTGNLWIAESAARDMQTVSLENSLRLTVRYRRKPELYERAAARWVARYAAEARRVTLADIELVTGLLRGVAAERPSREAIAALEAFASANGWRFAA
jgi:hypothetical protein